MGTIITFVVLYLTVGVVTVLAMDSSTSLK